MSTGDSQKLFELMKQKHTCLTRLRDLGIAQDRLIDEGDINHLLQVLGTKQQVLSALQTIERQLDPFRDQDPERRQWSTIDDRRQCAELVTDCEGILAQIIKQERASEHRLSHRRDLVAARLQGAHDASRTRGAYTAPAATQASHIDLSTSE